MSAGEASSGKLSGKLFDGSFLSDMLAIIHFEEDGGCSSEILATAYSGFRHIVSVHLYCISSLVLCVYGLFCVCSLNL